MPSDYVTSSRETKRTVYQAQYRNGDSLPWINLSTPQTFIDWERRTSRRNGWTGRPTGDRDVGGDFEKVTVNYDLSKVQMYQEYAQLDVSYKGPVLPTFGRTQAFTTTNYVNPIIMGRSQLLAQGTRFASEASPTRPQAGISVALAELKREGLPSLSSDVLALFQGGKLRARDVKHLAGATGSDYLNWMFGWLPVISDIKKLAKSVMDTDALMSQLYRDNGKLISRKRGNPAYTRVISESSKSIYEYNTPVGSSYLYPSGPGEIFSKSKTTRALWFSGAFMYHIPSDATPLGTLHALAIHARTLYGLSLDPEVIWDLIGFSWLADWVFNAGDVLHNIADTIYSDQVMRHGYVMCHTNTEMYWELSIRMGSRNTHFYKSPITAVFDVKQRIQATPFGFGLNWDGFTPYQLSILAALGISRSR